LKIIESYRLQSTYQTHLLTIYLFNRVYGYIKKEISHYYVHKRYRMITYVCNNNVTTIIKENYNNFQFVQLQRNNNKTKKNKNKNIL